jgi:UDP-N-acetylglucosamine--N-acetylmuramyl-(pentapeptide) pyrophosphoryl-undecaprenol N-acetylglucosamine transferase
LGKSPIDARRQSYEPDYSGHGWRYRAATFSRPWRSPKKCASAAGVVWLGNPDGMEARWCRSTATKWSGCEVRALRGKGLLRKLLLPLNLLLKGFWQAQKAIRQVQPNVVLGMGGYITFPGGMMAALLGKPLVVHEQNSVAGLANRVLAGVADRIA